MTDNSTFREIAEESAVDVSEKSDTSESVKEGVAEPTQSEEQKTETFIEDKDLTGMTPEQLLATKKEWEKAYTIKRQKETAQLKEYQAKIAELESLRSQAPVQPQNGHSIEDRANEAYRMANLGQMSIEDYTQYMQDLNAERAREIAREEYENLHKAERETRLAEDSLEKFRSADPRLDENSPDFDEYFKSEVQREIADLLDQHLEQHQSYEGFDAAALTKQIVERRDKQIDEIIKKRTQQSTQAAKMRDAKLRKSEVRGTTSQSQQVGGNSFRSILSETLDGAA